MTKRPSEPLNREDVEKLIAACGKGTTGIRNKALLAVLRSTGVRISEAIGITLSDIESGSIRVRHGKGGKDRVVGVGAGCLAMLELWLEKRRQLGFNGRQPVFCTLKGEPIKTAYVRALLARLAKRAGIEKRVHAHGFRHGHTTELVRQGVPLQVISQQLGHAHLSTTDAYVARLAPADVVAAVSALDI